MALAFRGRRWLIASAFVAAAGLCFSAAPAAVEMSTGIRYVIPAGSADDCSAKAKTALNAYLQNATEQVSGSGEWIASGPQGVTGPSTASAVVRCFPVGKGYVVTFTCVVQIPGNPYPADALCLDVAHNFSGKPVKPLPSPTPLPTGCTTANLVGTWVADDKPTLTLTDGRQWRRHRQRRRFGELGLIWKHRHAYVLRHAHDDDHRRRQTHPRRRLQLYAKVLSEPPP